MQALDRKQVRTAIVSVSASFGRGELQYLYHFGDRRLAGLDRPIDYIYSSPHLVGRPRIIDSLVQRVNAASGSLPETAPTGDDLEPTGQSIVAAIEVLHREGTGAPHTPAARLAYDGWSAMRLGNAWYREVLVAIGSEWCAANGWT